MDITTSHHEITSEGIFLFTQEEALAWAEQHLPADTIEEYFEVEEG